MTDMTAQAHPTTGASRGRRHLDGSPPGDGNYMKVVAFSLLPEDIADLTRLGDGNRSLGVRRLLALVREAQSDTPS